MSFLPTMASAAAVAVDELSSLSSSVSSFSSLLSSNETDIALTMTAILGTMVAFLGGLLLIQDKTTTTAPASKLQQQQQQQQQSSMWLPCPVQEPSKRAYEVFVALYTPFWIAAFGVIVAFQLYEQFTAWTYVFVCGGLAVPFWVYAVLPLNSPDAQRPLFERYAFKANVWLAIYGFIGNYWYTHYFYSVLKAQYTMPSHRLNNVPIAMFFATHFYFNTYHVFSNALLRKVVTTYPVPNWKRSLLFWSVIVVFSYFTAFMETLTISAYPYYSFEDRTVAYTVGSAFYGIYFLVSFPAFFYFDTNIDSQNDSTTNNNEKQNNTETNGTNGVGTTNGTTTAAASRGGGAAVARGSGAGIALWDTIVSSFGYSMMILCLLDFVRLYLDIPLVVGTASAASSGGLTTVWGQAAAGSSSLEENDSIISIHFK